MYHNQHILYYVETAVDQVLIWFFWSLFFKLLTQITYRFERCAFTNDNTGWKEPQWVILSSLLIKGGLGSGSMQRFTMFVVWLTKSDCMTKLIGITYPRISPRKISYTSIPSRKQTNKQTRNTSFKVFSAFPKLNVWLFVYLFFAIYSSSTHCRTGEEYLDQNRYWSQLHCVNLRF